MIKKVLGSEFKVLGSGFWAIGSGFGVIGSGFWVEKTILRKANGRTEDCRRSKGGIDRCFLFLAKADHIIR
jgi:hypothetical protein